MRWHGFLLDYDEDEGAARRKCVSCRTVSFIADSEEYWDDCEPKRFRCGTCRGARVELAVGFAMYEMEDEDEAPDVNWLYVGRRCVRCGALGCPVDWKVGYGPSNHLLQTA